MTTVTLTETQLNAVLSGLFNELLDCDRYISGSKEPDEPRPEDSCCDFHLMRYEDRRKTYLSLKERKRNVEDTIKLFGGTP